MSTKPRTPRHYPHMRVRGARRRRQAKFHSMQRAFDIFAAAFRRLNAPRVAAGMQLYADRAGAIGQAIGRSRHGNALAADIGTRVSTQDIESETA